MKKLSLLSFIALSSVALVMALNPGTAQSRPQYAKEFAKMYVKADSTDPAEQAFAAAVKGAKCSVCHQPGDDRKLRNRYGKALAEVIKPKDVPEGWKGEKDNKKIEEALTKVGEMHIEPKDPKSPTYAELIKAGKLPGGEKADEKK